jgi:membrane-bound metal-dependent hydrolase YbcI (DUF457 family)
MATAAQYLRGRRRNTDRRPALPDTALGTPMLALGLMVAANAPDFDFVPGILIGHPDWLHRGVSHSLAAAVLFGGAVWAGVRIARVGGAAWAGVLMGAGYASHLMLDMFSPDPLRFNGVPLLWPLTTGHFILPAQVFLDIRRDPFAGSFVASLWHVHNVQAMLRELLIMVPLLLGARILAAIAAAADGHAAVTARPRFDRRIDSES